MLTRSYALHTQKSDVHEYAAYGLRIGCSMPLPDLEATSSNPPSVSASSVLDDSAVDVVIRRSDLPPIPRVLANRSGLAIRSTRETAHLIWPECGQFLVRAGRTIDYRPATGRSEADLHAPLLGVVFGVLLAQRGVFTLHASAVAIRGAAIGFLGEKGAGKSTTAAALLPRGHRLLTDDVLAIGDIASDPPTAYPAFPRMKLWPDAIAANGRRVAPLPCVTPESEKRVQPTERFAQTPAPFSRIYLLDDGPRIHATRISEQEAFRAILPHRYAARFLGENGEERARFHALRQIATSVPVYRLTRPRSLDRLADLAAFVDAAQGEGDVRGSSTVSKVKL